MLYPAITRYIDFNVYTYDNLFMAKLIVDMSDDLKAIIQKYADKNKKTIKQVTMEALGLLIKDLNKK